MVLATIDSHAWIGLYFLIVVIVHLSFMEAGYTYYSFWLALVWPISLPVIAIKHIVRVIQDEREYARGYYEDAAQRVEERHDAYVKALMRAMDEIESQAYKPTKGVILEECKPVEGSRCPYCFFIIRPDGAFVTCTRCETKCHWDCGRAKQECSRYGCGGQLV